MAQLLLAGQTDVYSICSERLIRLVLEEGKRPTQYVWTPAAPDTSSSLCTLKMSIPNPYHPYLQKSQGSSCQVAVNRSHLHKTKHMAVCNVKWDVLVLIRDARPMWVKDCLASSLWRMKNYFFKRTVKGQSEVCYVIRPTVREFSSLHSDVFKPSFIFIEPLTRRGFLKFICWFILVQFILGILIRFSHNMQQAGFYHNTAFCFHGFHSAHNASKRMDKGEKKHDWWLLLEAHKHKQRALIDEVSRWLLFLKHQLKQHSARWNAGLLAAIFCLRGIFSTGKKERKRNWTWWPVVLHKWLIGTQSEWCLSLPCLQKQSIHSLWAN